MNLRKLGALASAATIALGVSACGSSKETKGSSGTSGSGAASSTLIGAGSTLVAPLVSKWIPKYEEEHKVAITYGPIGSGGGIAQITGRTVDFGASDAPLTEDELKEAKGVVQIPWALAATVIAYHVEGVPSKIHLTGQVLAEIWQGKISNWNDAKISALNPGVKFPSLAITPIHRDEGSGDTFAFTNFLSHVDAGWASSIGHSTEVHFPVGVGAKGNSGVGATLSSTDGTIGYIAIAYVLESKFDFAEVENAAGKFPEPSLKSISAAAAAFKSVPPSNEVTIVDPPASAPGAYPISTYTYALVPLHAPKASTLAPFLKWALTTGQQFGPELDFAALPEAVVKADEATIERVKS
ncbi:MAG: phosphate ABC transporter substrate-binding protein PstS [Solirubrobacteraceae bacterium]